MTLTFENSLQSQIRELCCVTASKFDQFISIFIGFSLVSANNFPLCAGLFLCNAAEFLESDHPKKFVLKNVHYDAEETAYTAA